MKNETPLERKLIEHSIEEEETMMREGICRSTAQNKEASSQRAIYTRPGYSVKSVVMFSVLTYVILKEDSNSV